MDIIAFAAASSAGNTEQSPPLSPTSITVARANAAMAKFSNRPTTGASILKSPAPPAPSQSSATATVAEPLCYKSVFEHNKNSLKILLSMSIGIKDDSGNLIYDPEGNPVWRASKHWSKIKPNKDCLKEEIQRRKTLCETPTKSPNSQKTVPEHVAWLNKHFALSEMNRIWIIEKMKKTLHTFVAIQPLTDSDPSRPTPFRGNAWLMRMIHSLVDFDDSRLAFAQVNDSLSRSELDGKNNPKTARVSAWEIVAKHYNDPTYNPWSRSFPLLHEDFKNSLFLSHEHVAKFGDVPAIKVKQRISELRCKLNIIKVNHGASGMGDGARTEEGETIDDRAQFLMDGDPSIVLYLWEMTKINGMLDQVLQRIGSEFALESGTSAIEVHKKKGGSKRKSPNKDDDDELLTLQMTRSNAAMEHFTEGMTRKTIRDLKKELIEVECKALDYEDMGKEVHAARQTEYARIIAKDIRMEEKRLDTYVKSLSGGTSEVEVESQ